MDLPSLHSHQWVRVLWLLILTSDRRCQFFGILGILIGVWWHLGALIGNSLMTRAVDRYFMHLFAICAIFEASVQIFCPVFQLFFWPSYCSVLSILVYFDWGRVGHLSHVFYRHFLQSGVFILLHVSFTGEEFLIFKSNISGFCFGVVFCFCLVPFFS